jgi:ribosomal protein L31E
MSKQNTQIVVRLTTAEKKEMQKRAHESYKTLSQFLRDKVLSND